MSNSNIRVINNVDSVTGLVSIRNWISNPNADINTQGWITYADAAGTAPVDGTGGSPNITWTRDTGVVYAGVANFLFTKDAANRQGQGASFQFSIDPTDRATVQQIKFDYVVRSGTFNAGSQTTDSDLTIWIYDTFNNVLIQPSTYKLFSNSSLTNGSFISNFQTSANSTDYRLIIHQSTTSSAAYSVAFNNFEVARTQYALGTLISDWQPYTPTFTGFGTPSNVNFWWRRVGGSLDLLGKFTSGTTTSTEARISLPSGLSGSSTIITSISMIGSWTRDGANAFQGTTLLEPGSTYLTFGEQAGAVAGLTKLNADIVLNGSSIMSIYATSIPIAGWAVQQQQSDVNDQRIVSFVGRRNAQTLQGYNTPQPFQIIDQDTHAGWNPSTNLYTVPIAGTYNVLLSLCDDNGGTSYLNVYKNGTTFAIVGSSVLGNYGGGCTQIPCVAGDTISVGASTGSGYIGPIGSLGISRVANPAQISSTSTVAAAYWLSSNFVAGPTVPINFDSMEIDTHGAVTTSPTAWRFTAPISGIYSVTGSSFRTLGAGIKIFKNGTAYKAIGFVASTTSAGGTWTGILKLNAGEYIDIRPDSSDTVTGGALNADLTANVNIYRIGI